MEKSVFRFKQFSVAQGKCAMKVNTDGVLLGAWADVSQAKTILDIGTGTGVIALMMAQKNTNAAVHAIDIDTDAYLQAKENFECSPWCNRLIAFQTSLQQFVLGLKYDVIISNPPYFVDDMKTENDKKNIAKHSVALTYEELLSGISRLLSEDGVAFIVVPAFNFLIIETMARAYNLFVARYTEVTAVEERNPYLALIQLARSNAGNFRGNITIQHRSGNFTDEYKLLTKEFYLKF